jgi:hypothetical protein
MTLKASFMCSKAYRQQVLEPIAQLTVSIGQPIHEGERLAATVKLVNAAFSQCIIMIDDSVQWRTLAISHPHKTEEILLNAAIQAGDDYLSRHAATFAQYFTIPYRIIRWKDWHGTFLWQTAIQAMTAHYANDALLREAIDTNVHSFLARYEKSAPANYNRLFAEKMCRDYLIEEAAIMKDFWVPLGRHYEVYPCGRNETMNAVHQRFIAPHHSVLLLPISLRFHRKKIQIAEPTT